MQKIIMHPCIFSPNFRCGQGGSKPQVSVGDITSYALFNISADIRYPCTVPRLYDSWFKRTQFTYSFGDTAESFISL